MGSPSRQTERGPRPIKTLLIEEAPVYAREVELMLKEAKGAPFQLESVSRVSDGLKRLAGGTIDLVLMDLAVPDGAGLSQIAQARACAPHVPIIVLSVVDDESVAVEAMHQGAQDYLIKGQLHSLLLSRAIRYAIERKRAETAQLQAEEKYHRIFENIVEGIFQTSPAGGYLSANPALARIYGYDSPKELVEKVTDIGRKLYVDPNRRAEFIRLMEQHDVVTGIESKIYRKDGSIIWISENVRAVRDENHQLLYYEGTVEDITQRRQAEESLRNSETLYHSLVETLPQNIFRKDLSKRFTFANQRFCQTLGKPLEEIVGKSDFDFFPPDLAAKYQHDDRLILETGKPFETIEEHQPPGGHKIYVQVVKTPLYDANGQIIGLQGIFWDITERKLAQERVQRANAELARSREELRSKNEQMEDDIKMAREIQQAILPQQYPTFPRMAPPEKSALRFSHRYFPSGAVGGDFFNVRALSDMQAGVFICDVMGHGVRSALVTAMVRALVEELTPEANDPGQLLTHINRDLRAILKQTGSPMFATAFYLIADLAAGEMRYANAGHPKQLLARRATSEVIYLRNADGHNRPPLGLVEASVYSTSRLSLSAGDLILLYTDGLYEVEGANQQLYNQELLASAVRRGIHLPTTDLFDQLLAEIRAFSKSGEFMDDVCLVGVEVERL